MGEDQLRTRPCSVLHVDDRGRGAGGVYVDGTLSPSDVEEKSGELFFLISCFLVFEENYLIN